MGVRQRLGLLRPSAHAPKEPMKELLVRFYRRGKLSAGDIGDAAHSFDPTPDSDVSRMSRAKRCDCSTKHQTRNASRSLLKTLNNDTMLPPVYVAKATFVGC